MAQELSYAAWEEEVTLMIERFDLTRSEAQAFVEAHEMALAALWRDEATPETAAVITFVKPAEMVENFRTQAATRKFELADDAAYFGQTSVDETPATACMQQLAARAVVRRAVSDILNIHAERGPAYTVSVCYGEDTGLANSRSIDAIMAALMAADEEYLVVRHTPTRDCDRRPYVGNVLLVHGNDGWDVICDYDANLEELLKGANALADALSEHL